MDAMEVFQARAHVARYVPPSLPHLPFPHVNLFVFGGMGAGKSSYINTLFSALAYKVVSPAKTRASADKSITLEFFQRDLSDKIYIYDAWGWSKTNYQNKEFEYILTGKMKHGYNCEDKNAHTYLRDTASIEHQVHCIIFVIPAKSADNADYISKLKQFIDEADALGKKYIVAISQLDKDEESFREYPQTLPGSNRAKLAYKQVATKLGIEQNLILPILNYTSETAKNEYIDTMALQVIERALDIAEDYMRDQDRDIKFRK